MWTNTVNPLDKLPPDKAKHALGGALLGTVAACATVVSGYAGFAWQAAVTVALLAGVLKEVLDAKANRKATGKWLGEPRGTPHGVEGLDALATALGGCIVALPLAFR